MKAFSFAPAIAFLLALVLAVSPAQAEVPLSGNAYVSVIGQRTGLPIDPAVRKAWAPYINAVHERVHDRFNKGFLAVLEHDRGGGPLNDPKLTTRIELVVDGNGRLVQSGVVLASGVPSFDMVAHEVMRRAFPMAAPPSAILSEDGHAYVVWEFHRDEIQACVTTNVRPFRLGGPRTGTSPPAP